jgi:hypothetical protein
MTIVKWDYDTREIVADGIVHVVGVTIGAISIGTMLVVAAPTVVAWELTSLLVYSFGLLSVLTVSALYNLWLPGRHAQTAAVTRSLEVAFSHGLGQQATESGAIGGPLTPRSGHSVYFREVPIAANRKRPDAIGRSNPGVRVARPIRN